MKTKTQTHTHNYGTVSECQSRNTNARRTGSQTHTPIESNIKSGLSGEGLASSAAAIQSSVTGKELNQKPSKPTEASAPVVAKKNMPSSLSTTRTAAGQSKGKKVCADGGSTSGLESANTQKTDIKYSALTATARKDQAESARIKNSFTPGPWKIERDNEEVRIVARLTGEGAHGHYTIARCYSFKSDTNLIAAAPELLAALKYIAFNSESETAAIACARAAIAKATGESK